MQASRLLVLCLCGAAVLAAAPTRNEPAMGKEAGANRRAAFSETQVAFSARELGDLKLIAHRGYQPVAPGNSLPAFRAAGERKYWAIETDIRTTKDGVLVCCHDAGIDHSFNGSGAIKDMTLAELYRFKINVGKGLDTHSDKELRIPLFREYLQICKDHGALPFIEHKAGDVAAMIAEARQYFADKDIIISSTDFAVLAQARAISKEIFVHHIFSSEAHIADLSALGNAGMAFNYTDLDAPETRAKVEGLIARAHAAGVKVCLRAGDDRATVKKMLELGLDYIPTNVVTMDEVRGGAERAAGASASRPTHPD